MTSRELFNIDGVSEQREIQCRSCPDGAAMDYSPQDAAIIRAKLKPHRCHTTTDKLCAGPLRPRPLATK